MTTSTPFDPDEFNRKAPAGLFYDKERGLHAHGIVARQVLTHPLAPKPGKSFDTCRLDELAGNTTFGIHLSEMGPGERKCAHRQLDETVTFILSGQGRSEYRQREDGPKLGVEWQAGDVYSIPCNAWHEHFNASEEEPTRKVAFKTGSLVNRLLYGNNPLYDQGPRFPDRFDDEPDYFTLREDVGPNRVRMNIIKGVADQPVPEADPELGEGVSVQHYDMTGQRCLDVSVTAVAGHGFVFPHRPLAEEAFVVLRGRGRTDIWQEGGVARSIAWGAGDVVAPPLGIWRQHVNTGEEEVRYLKVRNVFIERGLGVEPGTLGTVMPDRFPTIMEPGRYA